MPSYDMPSIAEPIADCFVAIPMVTGVTSPPPQAKFEWVVDITLKGPWKITTTSKRVSFLLAKCGSKMTQPATAWGFRSFGRRVGWCKVADDAQVLCPQPWFAPTNSRETLNKKGDEMSYVSLWQSTIANANPIVVWCFIWISSEKHTSINGDCPLPHRRRVRSVLSPWFH